MTRFVCALAASILISAALAAPGPQKGKKVAASPATAANPKQYNQFVTVDEFVKSKRPPRTAVSIEGYIALCYVATKGRLIACVTDSVDHILSAEDADRTAMRGAVAVLPEAAIKKRPGWGWTARGMQRFTMYTGKARAQKALHDVVAKVRLTGWTAAGRAVLNPVTKIEYQDDNGNWKILP